MCLPLIDNHTVQGCSGFEPLLLLSADVLQQSALTVRLRTHAWNWNNGKYIATRSNELYRCLESHKWAVKAQALITYLKLKFHEQHNDYFISNIDIFKRIWVEKKINSCLRRWDYFFLSVAYITKKHSKLQNCKQYMYYEERFDLPTKNNYSDVFKCYSEH